MNTTVLVEKSISVIDENSTWNQAEDYSLWLFFTGFSFIGILMIVMAILRSA
ncbi:MAG: hypothetical protein K8F91_12275 [Candidatus Obscuribacterales bacterium]|nr:hypothetical protein [Candidatus Obscuribacterales bacterium]